MVGHRVGEELQLRAVGRHGDLGAIETVVQARVAPAGQIGGKAVAVEATGKLGELREHEPADGSDGETSVVHGHPDGSALEVAAVERLAAGDVDDRVVVDGVDLPLDRLGGEADDLDLRAEPLRRRADGVPVLPQLRQPVKLALLLGKPHVGAAFQYVLHDGRSFDLSRVVLQRVDEVVGVLRIAGHHLAVHRREDLGKDGQDVGLEEHDRREAGAHGRAVDDGEPFLGLQREEPVLDAGDPERLSGVHLAAVRGHRRGVLAAGDEAGDVGQRDQVAGRGDGAPERQARRHVGVEQLGDGLEDLEADARVALGEGVDAHQHGCASDLRRQRVAVAAAGSKDAGVEVSLISLSGARRTPWCGGGRHLRSRW
ncbi:Os12g0521101 [Oryza sativa Japonica Group]|uniref:Os12g0521101 protein n=1 Tax=Oryza sativa subsp. japonica TaxID=39947 RepID=A0A0P0YB53_ORYSJ|nr:Os12g0521101 [Oryza sativa Japonica Group]